MHLLKTSNDINNYVHCINNYVYSNHNNVKQLHRIDRA